MLPVVIVLTRVISRYMLLGPVTGSILLVILLTKNTRYMLLVLVTSSSMLLLVIVLTKITAETMFIYCSCLD